MKVRFSNYCPTGVRRQSGKEAIASRIARRRKLSGMWLSEEAIGEGRDTSGIWRLDHH